MSADRGLKRSVERSAREALFGSPLFPSIRNAYQYVFDRRKLAPRARALDSYGGLISAGDLIFDIGANNGDYSDTFLALGAQVVAVEPNPACCERLRLVAKRRGNLYVENCAIGRAEGSASMHFSSNSGLSTLSDEWYEIARTSPIHKDATWRTVPDVRVTTLDFLTKKYGKPKFVKIDVEGFEEQVLEGMSYQPEALSFEFHRQLLNRVHSCLRARALEDRYRFNYTTGMHLSFMLDVWVPGGGGGNLRKSWLLLRLSKNSVIFSVSDSIKTTTIPQSVILPSKIRWQSRDFGISSGDRPVERVGLFRGAS